MSAAPRLDGPTIDWICAGPERAPDAVVAASLAHVAAHPRRRFDPLRRLRAVAGVAGTWRPGWWVDGPLARAATTPALVGVAVVLVVAGFALGSAWNRAEPSPAQPGEARGTVAVGLACRVGHASRVEVVGGVERSRDGWLDCEVSGSDARLAGSMTVYLDRDRRPDGTGEAWGAVALETAEGRWTGAVTGTIAADGALELTMGLVDERPGHRALLHGWGSMDRMDLVGTVRAAGDPTPAGEPVLRMLTCTSGDGGTEWQGPDGVTHVTGRSMTCDVLATDPRLAGRLTLVAALDVDPDTSARIAGTESLAVAGGAWLGRWAGTYDTGWSTHRWTGVVTGSGDHAGSRYAFTTIGLWPRFVQLGVIDEGE